jgi:hypothetical protein
MRLPERRSDPAPQSAIVQYWTAHHTPFVPADAGTHTLLQELGSRFRGNERGHVSTQNNNTLKRVRITLTLIRSADNPYCALKTL